MNANAGTAGTQAALWNGSAGLAWVAAQAMLDAMFRPFEERLVGTIGAAAGLRLLDVGCGTGSTTLALARRTGAAGHALGVDVSAPMIALAQARAAREGSTARFVQADAQAHGFAPASFDRIVSRFGVMFFDDPLAAFANLRRAARAGGELHCIVWRGAADNPFMTTAERAAAPLLANLPARRADGPGQFSFADRDRVSALLAASGWADIEIRPIDVECAMPEPELVPYFSRLGPVGFALQALDEASRARVVETVRTAFDPYVHGAQVCYTAACWIVGARAIGDGKHRDAEIRVSRR